MKILNFVILLFAVKVYAYPEFIRHGYSQCITCHESVTGGSLISPYGRTLSKELLSQSTLAGKSSSESFEQAGFGLVNTPEWLRFGGDVRLLQSFVESPQVSQGRFLIMQVDLDFVAQLNSRIKTMISVGRIETRKAEASAQDFVSSPRHWLEYLITDPEAENRMAVRIGRFFPAYGVAFAEHTFSSRSWLGFGPGQEKNIFEFSWIDKSFEIYISRILAKAMGNQILHEEGWIVQIAKQFGETSKVGLNFLQAETQDFSLTNYDQKFQGLFAHIGFTKNFYGLFDFNQIYGSQKTWGVVLTSKFGYELWQGFHLLGVHEFANRNAQQADPRFEGYSVGAQWFPREHFDLLAYYRKERESSVSDQFQDSVWLIAHLYL